MTDNRQGKYRGSKIYKRVYERLVAAAKEKRIVFYKEIFEIMKLPSGNHAAKQAGQVLGEICEDTHAAGKPMLSSLVVAKSTKIPGPGFFIKAVELGRLQNGATETEEYYFWEHERDEVFSAQW